MKTTAKERAANREYKRKQRKRESLYVKPDNRPLDIDEGLDWIQKKLVVPTGMLTAKPFEIYPWQEEWIRGAYADGVRQAGLSVARKNGKSGVVAALMIAHLAGPWNRPNWRGVVTSLTASLAKELQLAICQTASASKIELDLKRSPAPGVIYGQKESRLDFIAADKSSGHSLSVDLAVIDELGLLPEAKRGLVNAMYSSISARDGKFFGISIQGDGPMFSEMRGMAGADTVHWKQFVAPSDADPMNEAAWYAANPGLGTIKSLDYMRDSAQRALSNPADMAYFRAYDLNQDLDPNKQMLIPVSDWTALYDEDCRLENEPVAIGLDLGGSVSMTAAVAIGLHSGIMRCWGAFPATPGLLERGRSDSIGTRYLMMQERGELALYDGRIVNVSQFLHDVIVELEQSGCEIAVIGADRYRKAEVFQVFDEVGYRGAFEARGQGASSSADGSADVRAFQRLVYTGGIKMRPSLLMESAVGKSALRFDGSGNPALDKSDSRARIDAVSAAVIASGLFEKGSQQEQGGGMVIVG